jgi:transposase-like protein
MNTNFNSFAQMMMTLPDDKACREYLELKRWNGTPVCPHCGVVDANHYRLNVKGEFRGMYKCKSCKQRFTVTLGTMFEGSPISLRKWFIATYIFASHKKGISSHQLARDLGVTQKTAWFMLHRLRMAFTDQHESPLGGEGMIVETDTTIVGGKIKNMHKSKRKHMGKGKGTPTMQNKTAVAGYVERGGNIRFDVVDFNEHEKDMVTKHVDTDSILMTDEAHCYVNVGKEYAAHEAVRHSMDEYVRGNAHTNTIEGAFSHFDRMVIGTYHSISRKHMQVYCNEIGFRYNSRKVSDKERFDMALIRTEGVNLPYTTLIAK